MALQLFVPKVTVHEFKYKMDGNTTGELYIMESTEHGKLCSFRSAATGLESPWHGSWSGSPEGRMLMKFDYNGRPHKAAFKWAQVEYRQVWGEFQSEDYMDRRIQMAKIGTWTL